MKINSINYEAFALEYIEGTLSEEKRQEMELFLSKHPTIAQELEGLKEFPIVKKEAIVYPNKKELLKRVSKRPLVLPLFYRRIAASVALILLVGSVYFRLFYEEDVGHNPIFTQEENMMPATPTNNTSSEEVEIADMNELPPAKPFSPLAKARRSLKEGEASTKQNLRNEDRLAGFNKKSPQLTSGINKTNSISKVKGQEISASRITLKETASTKNQLVSQSSNKEESNPYQSKKSTIERISKISKGVSNIAALPTIHQQIIPYKQQKINLPTKQLFEQSLVGVQASSPSTKRTLKSFLGKLPVKVEKNAFIPSFFTEEVGGQ